MKEQFYFERTVFLRCAANGNPPVRYTWRRGHEVLSQGSDAGVEIYEPFFTQVSKGRRWDGWVGGWRLQTPASTRLLSESFFQLGGAADQRSSLIRIRDRMS